MLLLALLALAGCEPPGSASALLYTVSTDTTGKVISGYSRTGSREKDKIPKSISKSVATVARTGRSMESADSLIVVWDEGSADRIRHGNDRIVLLHFMVADADYRVLFRESA